MKPEQEPLGGSSSAVILTNFLQGASQSVHVKQPTEIIPANVTDEQTPSATELRAARMQDVHSHVQQRHRLNLCTSLPTMRASPGHLRRVLVLKTSSQNGARRAQHELNARRETQTR